MTIVIIFQVREAREQLLKRGVVVTCRGSRRSHVGRDYATDKRGGRKICDVLIEYIGTVKNAEELRPWYHQSGFATADDWIAKVRQMYGKAKYRNSLNQVHLYKVIRADAYSKMLCRYCKELGTACSAGMYCPFSDEELGFIKNSDSDAVKCKRFGLFMPP